MPTDGDSGTVEGRINDERGVALVDGSELRRDLWRNCRVVRGDCCHVSCAESTLAAVLRRVASNGVLRWLDAGRV